MLLSLCWFHAFSFIYFLRALRSDYHKMNQQLCLGKSEVCVLTYIDTPFFLKENARKQKTLVCEKFDHLYTILEEKKREMSQKVTAEQEEKVNYIRGLTRKYGDHLEESCKIVEMGIQTMEEPEMALFLQVGLDHEARRV